MTLPALLLGFFLATLYGALFHLWRGGGFGRLLLYVILGWVGFAGGHAIAAYFAWEFDRLGPLHIGAATAGALVFLGVGYWLSLVEVDKQPERRKR